MSEYMCLECNGSGEGRFEGSRCPVCKGTGVESMEHEESEDPVQEDDAE